MVKFILTIGVIALLWVGLYAQTVQNDHKISRLEKELKETNERQLVLQDAAFVLLHK